MTSFSTEILQSPKAVLYYGPAGTGKSFLIRAMIENACFHQVTLPLGAADLQRGVEGDQEKAFNALVNRARCIPWVMCAVLLDGIDILAASGSGKRGSSLLASLLSITDHSAVKCSNLKVFAVTNRIEDVESSMLKRFTILRYLGNPIKEAREQCLDAYLHGFLNKQLIDPLDPELPQFILEIDDIVKRKQVFADLIDYFDQNSIQSEEVKLAGLLCELNDRGIPIENIDTFKEDCYDKFLDYREDGRENITELDDKMKVVAFYLAKMKDFRNEIIGDTMNFSVDDMRKLLERLFDRLQNYHTTFTAMSIGSVARQFYQEGYDAICKESNILLGGQTFKSIRAAGEREKNRTEMDFEQFIMKAT